MSIEEKMNFVIKSVLGEYTVKIIDSNEFNVLMNGDFVMNVKTVFFLDSHWRHEISEAIKKIISGKTKQALNEV